MEVATTGLVHGVYLCAVSLIAVFIVLWLLYESNNRTKQYYHQDVSKGLICYVALFFACFATLSQVLFAVAQPSSLLYLPMIYLLSMSVCGGMVYMLDRKLTSGNFLVWLRFTFNQVKNAILPVCHV